MKLIKNKIEDLITRNERRLHIDLDKLRQFSPDLTNELIKHPSKIINFFVLSNSNSSFFCLFFEFIAIFLQ